METRMIIPANLGVALLPGRRFRPAGPIVDHGTWRRDATARPADDARLAARFFVSMSVGGQQRWTLEDVLAVVSRLQPGGASFVAQRGVWTSIKRGPREEEAGAQVLIVNAGGQPRAAFVAEMGELADALVREMKQEAVYLDVQDRGVVIEGYTSTP
jgi:hypothetical protein